MRLALRYSQLALLATLHAGCRPASRPAAGEVLSFVTVMSHREAGTAEVHVDRDGRRTARSFYSDRGNTETLSTELLLDSRGAPRWFRATGKDHFNQPIGWSRTRPSSTPRCPCSTRCSRPTRASSTRSSCRTSTGCPRRSSAAPAAMQHLVKLAWDRHIPIVPGTDYIAGLSLAHELELYVQAGIPAPDVLALATLGTARVMGRDRDAGSTAAGKLADLVLVAGDPTRDIAAVRNTTTVLCRGIVYDPAELFASVGMRARVRRFSATTCGRPVQRP